MRIVTSTDCSLHILVGKQQQHLKTLNLNEHILLNAANVFASRLCLNNASFFHQVVLSARIRLMLAFTNNNIFKGTTFSFHAMIYFPEVVKNVPSPEIAEIADKY